jgi:hypothetical protein
MRNLTAVLVTSTVFGFTAIVVFTSVYFRHRARQMRHETIRLALEKGQPLPPELLGVLREPEPARGDLQRGVKLIAVGIGLSVFLFLMHKHAWPVGLILLALGAGYLVSHWLTGRGPPTPPAPR